MGVGRAWEYIGGGVGLLEVGDVAPMHGLKIILDWGMLSAGEGVEYASAYVSV